MKIKLIIVRMAWWLIGFGMLSGAILGAWSFGGPVPAPQGFIAYDDLPRRLLRLAHIALIALPLLNLELLRALTLAPLHAQTEERVLLGMLFGMVGLPLLLALAACWPPALYLLPLPVCALMGSAFCAAWGISRSIPAGTP